MNVFLGLVARCAARDCVLYVNAITPEIITREQATGLFNCAHFMEHVNFFSVTTLDRLMAAHGFTPHAHRKKSMATVFFERWYEFQGSRA